MKLAEALQERADLNRKIAELRGRIINNALVQEGEKPAEEPDELIEEMNSALLRLNELIAGINLRNAATMVDGKTLTELIAERDTLTLKVQAYRATIDAASRIAQRATRSEIRIVSAVNVKELQKEADAASKKLRETDLKIQEINWLTEY